MYKDEYQGWMRQVLVKKVIKPGRIHTSNCRNVKSFGVVQGWVHMQFWLTVAQN